jgi:hypothetical protein
LSERNYVQLVPADDDTRFRIEKTAQLDCRTRQRSGWHGRDDAVQVIRAYSEGFACIAQRIGLSQAGCNLSFGADQGSIRRGAPHHRGQDFHPASHASMV